jgi:tRNA G18 (ribose-2'-O)-methylase SpoU
MGAAFIFTVGRRYKRQSSDVLKTWRHIPLFHYDTLDQLYDTGLPYDCLLIGIEMDESAVPIKDFQHPQRAIYLLGAEDNGLMEKTIKRCHKLIVLPGERSMNVAVAGSIVMFDRLNKG